MTKSRCISNVSVCILCTVCAAFSLMYPDKAANAALSGLSLCAKGVVPSLVLFMAAAKIFIAAGGAGFFSGRLGNLAGKIFHLSCGGVCALFLGLISGYPMGAVVLSGLVKRGEIEKEEADSILPFVTAASPAFVIGTVGNAMFSSKKYGAALLSAQIVSSLLLIFLTRGKRNFDSDEHMKKSENRENAASNSLLSAVVGALKETGSVLLCVCVFVTFFYILSSLVTEILPQIIRESAFSSVIGGILEISGGFFLLSQSGAGKILSYFIGGVILGFSGVSVMMQSADAALSLDLKKYFFGKLIQSALCGVLCTLFGFVLEGNVMSAVVYVFGKKSGIVCNMTEIILLSAIFLMIIFSVMKIAPKAYRFFSKKR